MDRYAVIGLGRFGYRLAVLLSRAGAEVVAVDGDRSRVEDIRDSVALAVCLDATDEQALRTQGLDKVDVAVVGIGTEFESAVLTTVILKQLGIRTVVSRASNPTRGEILKRVGADLLVNPEQEAAKRWAHRLLGPDVIEQIELAEGHSLVQVPVPQPWVGSSLAELDIRRKFQVNVVAIRQLTTSPDDPDQTRATIETPLPHSKLQAKDVLFLIGADEDISALPK